MRKCRFSALGTEWSVETETPLTAATKRTLRERLAVFDATYSRFLNDSLVTTISKSPGTYTLPADAPTLFSFYYRLYKATDGAVTPLVGNLLSDLGYDASYSLQPKSRRRAVPTWDDCLQWNGRTLTVTRPVLLDFGAAGKGYAADIVAKLLIATGHHSYVVDASGDIVCHGPGVQERIGLEDPRDPTRIIGVTTIHNASLCASATNRRTWGNGLHHVVDPFAAAPTMRIAATWVVAANGLTADGLATALFLTEPAALQEFSFEYVRLFTDGSIDYSPGFPGELYT